MNKGIQIIIPVQVLKKTGGVERYVIEISRAFCRTPGVAGVYIVTTAVDDATVPQDLRKLVTIVTVDRPAGLFWWYGWRKAEELRRRLGPQAVIFGQQANALGGHAVIEHACHPAAIYELNSNWPKRLLRYLRPKHFLACAIEIVNHHRAARSIAISDKMRRDMERFLWLKRDKIDVIYSGVNAHEFAFDGKARESIRQQYGLSGKFVLIFVANEFRRKNLTTVLKAMAAINDPAMHLLVAGKDDPAGYFEQARSLGIADRVQFIGSVRNIAQHFAAADVFVYPTLSGPFDLVVFESMAVGVPIVTSCALYNGVAEVIEHGKSGMLMQDPLDVAELCQMLTRLRDDREFRESVGRSARDTAAKFTWDRTAGQIAQVLARVADNNAQRK